MPTAPTAIRPMPTSLPRAAQSANAGEARQKQPVNLIGRAEFGTGWRRERGRRRRCGSGLDGGSGLCGDSSLPAQLPGDGGEGFVAEAAAAARG